MKVVIIRHAEMDFCWSKRCTSNMFDSDCRGYDSASIIGSMYKIPVIGYQRIYISELSRSRDTAEILFPNCDYIVSKLINEVPLKSSFDTAKKMPLWFWNTSGRIQWFMNSDRQIEGHSKTVERARQFVAMISDEDADCAVVTHGFFMHTLLREIKKTGFRTNKSSATYKNGEYVIAEK